MDTSGGGSRGDAFGKSNDALLGDAFEEWFAVMVTGGC